MTFAQFVGQGSTGIVGVINTIIVPLIISLAFLVFFWGVIKYLFINGDSESERTNGRYFMLWGVIGLALIFAIWGIINVLLSTLGITPAR